MASRHPYVNSRKALMQAIPQFRKSLPSVIDASVLKKLGFAPKNESRLINVLRFIGVIDTEANVTTEARSVFTQHDDAAFAQGFETLIETAYADLFSLHNDVAWDLDNAALVTYFRQTDQTTASVGKWQATTFQLLSAFAGHAEMPTVRETSSRKGNVSSTPSTASKPKRKTTKKPASQVVNPSDGARRDFGMTVRIEINLPADGDKQTYDHIFKSIRENLLDG